MSSERPVALSDWVNDHAKDVIQTPARILVIVVLAFVIRMIVHRLINRLVRPIRDGDPPRLLAPFRERGSSLLESAGLLSERRSQRASTIASVLKSITSVVIFLIAFMMILAELGFSLAPLIAGTGVVGVALGFGAQNVIKDFLSGMFMILEDQYGVGDVIDFELASGTVEAVGLRVTQLRDFQGTVWYVRNGEVMRVGNKSQGYATVVLDIQVDAYGDVEGTQQAMLAAANEVYEEPEWSELFLDAPTIQGIESITLDETVIRMVARVRPLEQWKIGREIRARIRARLDRLNLDESTDD